MNGQWARFRAVQGPAPLPEEREHSLPSEAGAAPSVVQTNRNRTISSLIAAAAILAQLYAASRLFVNFFQPSFKLEEKLRIGARTVKRCESSQTRCSLLRALASTGLASYSARTLDRIEQCADE